MRFSRTHDRETVESKLEVTRQNERPLNPTQTVLACQVKYIKTRLATATLGLSELCLFTHIRTHKRFSLPVAAGETRVGHRQRLISGAFTLLTSTTVILSRY